MKKDLDNNIIIKYFFIAIILFFAITSIAYAIQNKEIVNLNSDTWLMRAPDTTQYDSLINATVYTIIFIALFYCYWKIINNHDKILKDWKNIIIFIAIVTFLFSLIIPFTSHDVYSYIGFGAAQSEYNENPYYITINQLINKYGEEHDLIRGVAPCWRNEPAVYGPLWAYMCKIFTSLSVHNLNVSLFIFKFFAMIVHGINCLLIWKIINNKKIVLLYGLNPFILFEAISQVHNDLYIVLFVLLSLYFLLNKKKLWISILFIAMATAIKYFTIILVPFLVIYSLDKNENVWKSIGRTFLYAFEFLFVIGLFYLIYAKDLKIFFPLFLQQGKYCKSLYLMVYLLFNNFKLIKLMSKYFLFIYILIYISNIIILFFNKQKYTLNELMEKYLIYLLLFIFILITNFNHWYYMWVFPVMLFLKEEDNKKIIFGSFLLEIAMFPMILVYRLGYKMGIYYCLFFYCGMIIYYLFTSTKNNKILKTKK